MLFSPQLVLYDRTADCDVYDEWGEEPSLSTLLACTSELCDLHKKSFKKQSELILNWNLSSSLLLFIKSMKMLQIILVSMKKYKD